MGIGDSAGSAMQPKRGCVQKMAIGFAGLVIFGFIGHALQKLSPSSAPSNASHSSSVSIPPFTFDPITTAQKSEALRHMRKEVDQVEDDAFYYDQSSSRSMSSTAFYPFIGKQGDRVWLLLEARYSASDWLFFNKIVINADGVIFEMTPNKIDRHAGYGYVAEWVDLPVQVKEISMLDVLKDSKNVTVRFQGPQFHFDKKMTAQEKQAISNVFAAYQALGGTAPQ